MTNAVYDTAVRCKPPGCIFSNPVALPVQRYLGMAPNPKYRPTFIKQWREHRGMSQAQLAERVPMDKGNLSKVERGILPYNQGLLERLADALMTDPASLIMRDPTDQEAVWSLWDHATKVERRQIEGVVNALVSAKKRA